jgi:hypothetical protein
MHCRCRRRDARARVESLEFRRLLTVFAVTGTPGDDTITVVAGGGNVTITVNGTPTTQPDASVTGISVDALGGNDTIAVQDVTNNPTTLLGGDGDDRITVTIVDFNASTPAITTDGGSGTDDAATLSDPNNTFADRWTVTASTITRTFFAGLSFPGVEALRLECGPGANRVDVTDTPAGVTTQIAGGGGADDFRVAATAPGTAVQLDGGPGLDAVLVDPTFSGRAAAILTGSQDLALVDVRDDGTVSMGASLTDVVSITGLSLSPAATFDVGQGSAVWDYDPVFGSPFAGVAALISSGYNGGAWDGAGISSAAARLDSTKAVGYAEANAVFTGFPASYAGIMVDDSSVLFRYTLSGDANLNRSVAIEDFSQLATNFNVSPRPWSAGNFNFDAGVTLGDFAALASNYNLSIPSAMPAARGVFSGAPVAGVIDRVPDLVTRLTA